MSDLTHLNPQGRARMVDVSAKDVTAREARAAGEVRMKPETVAIIREGRAAKGDVLAVAQVAGIMGAKSTAQIIPLCHPLPLTGVDLDFELDEAGGRVGISATVRTTARTGVEMEALTAVTVAALTIYDMCKAVDKGMVIGEVRVTHKSKTPI
ncbi:MAG TPA: cyclic pyranopterin monophosphate synthase MoaC [Chloroflexota bacterium]|nr:cyclic pyranopterin monophosphate synthase MoaC [Chloroflexota bacterium]